MNDKETLISVLIAEERKIKEALRSAGYYAYKITLRPNYDQKPDLFIEANEWTEGDEKRIPTI